MLYTWFVRVVTNYGEGGGATKREGGHAKFYPYEKGGGAKTVLAMLKGGGGGGTTSFEVVLTRELEVLTIVMGGCKKFYPVLRGGGAKSFRPAIFPFCSPPSPLLMTSP